MSLDIEHRAGVVRQGVGAVVVAGETHAFSADAADSFVVADLPARDGVLPEVMADRFVHSPFFVIDRAVQGLVDFLAIRLSREALTGDLLVSWSKLLFGALAEQAGLAARAGTLDGAGRRSRLFEQAMAYMRARLHHPIGVRDISAACGVSERALHRLFKMHAGQSPYMVLAELRLEAACKLLMDTDLPIAEIALRSGHSDQSALTRRLRLSHGITPAAFRRCLHRQ
ncbi:helix-turn-helix domain-containing protein [Rhodoligotrophos defluvii]|uniref:helix-turn-helix domain-containing protein n=1 Tax=Rhodoligotrophos defluvii TaxID=2561934 RepID=UPI0014856A1E|nr:AraC family transcriptional regulator [Rhodoligotrophos defluvii]